MQNKTMRLAFRCFSTAIPLVFACAAGATTLVTNVTMDGSSGINYSWWTKSGPPGDYIGATMGGQLTGSGQYDLTLKTDNPLDPTFTLGNSLVNSSGFTWNSFIVDVSMSSFFSISGVANSTPGDWSYAVTPTSGPVAGIYTGEIVFDAGTPVPNGGNFNFTYSVTFSGGPNFGFTEAVTPVPEPSLSALLGLGACLSAVPLKKRFCRR
jgi:hypothetical protein